MSAGVNDMRWPMEWALLIMLLGEGLTWFDGRWGGRLTGASALRL